MKRVVLAFVLGLVTGMAQAAAITYEFTVSSLTGRLAGGSSTGYFTFDDSIIPSGGGLVSEGGMATDLSFTLNSVAYDETTASLAWMEFDIAGALMNFGIGSQGTHCLPGICVFFDERPVWYVSAGASTPATGSAPVMPGTFFYVLSENEGDFGWAEQISFSLKPNLVPEPASLALLGLGLAGLALRRRRA